MFKYQFGKKKLGCIHMQYFMFLLSFLATVKNLAYCLFIIKNKSANTFTNKKIGNIFCIQTNLNKVNMHSRASKLCTLS